MEAQNPPLDQRLTERTLGDNGRKMGQDTKGYREIFCDGLREGLRAFLWMAKIVIPTSYATALMAWLGILQKITALLGPFMGYLGLPNIAAVPLIAGALSSVYAGIAAMVVLPFSEGEMILMANFILICHNMIQETIIQTKSGLKAWKAISIRIISATLTVYVLKIIMNVKVDASLREGGVFNDHLSFIDMNLAWLSSTGILIAKIFFIIMGIMLLLELGRAKNLIDKVCRLLYPFLRVMGLSERVSILWMTAVVFGLAYGGAVIVAEAQNHKISKEELEALQLSIGINHSMVEDPTLFLPLGLPAGYLWVPRIITAMIATRILYLLAKLKRFSPSGRPLPLDGNKG